jgi:predicted dehydrogenase
MTSRAQTGKRHRLLIVGVGSIGERHVRCFLRTDRANVSICEVNDALRDSIAGQYELDGDAANLDQALEKPYDAAVVAVPANLHVAIAVRLLQAGLDVLIEKPLATDMSGVDALLSVARAEGRVAAVAYVYRAQPALYEMREAIASGSLGTPVELVAVCGQHFPKYRPRIETPTTPITPRAAARSRTL